MVLLKFNFSKLNTSKVTLFTQLNKSEQYLVVAQGPKSIILNNRYKIYCVKCPWFWFLPIFVPYATWAVFCSIDEILDACLLPSFAISNSALKGNSLIKILNLLKSYKTLFISKWMWSCVCPICNVNACKLVGDSASMGLPSHYSICPSQLKYQMKNFWLKASCMSNC